MSNARKLANIVVGTEVVISSVDSDLANKINSIKSRLDSDDAKLQSLDTVIKTGLTNLVDSDLIINQLQAKISNIVTNNDSDSAALQAIKTQIGLIQGRQDSDSNQIQSLSTSLLGEISSTNTNITSIVSRLDSDELKLQSLDTTLVQIKSRLDSDEIKIQSVTSLAVTASSSGAISDSDLKVVADLRNQLDSEILYVKNLNLSYTNYTYIATAGQTSFTGSDANSLTLAYTAGSIQVFLNGFKLETDDYTATDGTSVVLTRGASASHQLTILVPTLESNYVPPIPEPDWASTTQQAKLIPSPYNYGAFGISVALDGDTAAIGQYIKTHPVGDPTNGSQQGSGYIFTRSGSTWTQAKMLLPSDLGLRHQFGFSCAIDSGTAIFSSVRINNDTGAVYVFTGSGTNWTQQAKIVPADASAGNAVGKACRIHGDELMFSSNTTIGGQSGMGSVYYYTRSGTTWTQQQRINPPTSGVGTQKFGNKIDFSPNGYMVLGSAYGAFNSNTNSGQAYIYYKSGGTWSLQATLDPSNAGAYKNFGDDVAINDDGDTVVIGSVTSSGASGSAYVFTRSGSTWTQAQELIPSDATSGDAIGRSVAIDRNSIVIGAHTDDDDGSASGGAWIYKYNGSTWDQVKKLTASDAAAGDQFTGQGSLEIDATTQTIIAGSPEHNSAKGAVYIFTT